MQKAAAQIIEINKNRDELRRLGEERSEKNEALTALEANAGELRNELRRREEQLQQISNKLLDAEARLEERALELDKMGRMYDEATFASSSRQIELVARETEVEKLSTDVSDLRDQRKEADRKVREMAAETKAAQDALKLEKRRASDLETRLERTISTLSDREEKLDRREKELGRLREEIKTNSGSESDLSAELSNAQEEKVKLEGEVAELTLQMSKLLEGAKGADIEKAMEKLNADRDRIEGRLKTLVDENKKLRKQVEVFERDKSDDWDEERRENALLREQINDLAAEVVNLTMALDGPDSPIRKALDETPPINGAPKAADTIVNLADRVRALQKAAATQR
ncbi:MAG: hypothetical protein KDJ43_00035 [Rhizobiaceae bacterium]|nr:hypothetical protein [Rhizobiaceae bacterium]